MKECRLAPGVRRVQVAVLLTEAEFSLIKKAARIEKERWRKWIELHLAGAVSRAAFVVGGHTV